MWWLWTCSSSLPNSNTPGKRAKVVGTAHQTTFPNRACTFPIRILSIELHALLDSGSPISMLSTNIIHKFRHLHQSQLKFRSTHQQFTAVNGSSFTTTTTVSLPVIIQDNTITVEFHLVPILAGYAVILGRNFLQTGYSLDFLEDSIQLKRLPLNKSQTTSKLTSNFPFSLSISNPESPFDNPPAVSTPDQPIFLSNAGQASEYVFLPKVQGPRVSQLTKLIHDYSQAFAKDENDVGRTHLASHRIITSGPSVQSSPYKVPYIYKRNGTM
jgi:hypothetical protein